MAKPNKKPSVIVLAFLVVLGLVCAMAGFSISTAYTLNKQSNQVAEHLIPRLEVLGQLQRALTQRQHLFYLLYVSGEEQTFNHNHRALQQQIDQNMAALEEMLTEHSLLIDLQFEVDLYRDLMSQIETKAQHTDNHSINQLPIDAELSTLLIDAQKVLDSILIKLDSLQLNTHNQTTDNTGQVLTEIAQITKIMLLFSIAFVVTSGVALKMAYARQKDRDRLFHIAYHDELTGLPNYLMLQRKLQQLEQGTLVVIKTERLSRITGTYGLEIAKTLILQINEWLVEQVKRGNSNAELYRYHDDSWAVVYPSIEQNDKPLLEALAQIDREPFVISDRLITVVLKAGITQFPRDGDSPEQIMRNADAAILAISAKRSAFNLFTPSLATEAQQWLAIESGLHQALQKNELELYYQAKLDTKSGTLSGAEALIRWHHDGQMVSPGQFIPVAEESGLIVPIGTWVIEQACRQLAAWRTQGLQLVPIAVNISAQQFQQDDFFDIVTATLTRHRLSPRLLELEITEEVAAMDPKLVIATMQRLKQAGLKLAIDDFGTGYSSLAYLQRLPVDSIKIDRSFVSNIDTNSDNAAIVDMILTLSKQKELVVVAEGVETEEELRVLRRKPCDLVQGFLFAKPEPETNFTQRLIDASKLN